MRNRRIRGGRRNKLFRKKKTRRIIKEKIRGIIILIKKKEQ